MVGRAACQPHLEDQGDQDGEWVPKRLHHRQHPCPARHDRHQCLGFPYHPERKQSDQQVELKKSLKKLSLKLKVEIVFLNEIILGKVSFQIKEASPLHPLIPPYGFRTLFL